MVKLIVVVRQQFVMGINCSIFLYRKSFGANQGLALIWKSFRISQVSHCAVQRAQQSANVLQYSGFVYTDSLCVVCTGYYYLLNFQL